MEKNITISTGKKNTSFVNMMADTSFIIAIANLFSAIMEEEVTPRQTLYILNMMTALFMTVFPVMPFVLRLLCITWLCVSVLQCRMNGVK